MLISNLRVLLLCTAMLLMPGALSASDAKIEDQVSFQVEVGREVDNDRVTALMNLTAENNKPAQLADTINRTMQWALEQARGSDKVKVRSGTYQTYPVYEDQKIVRWRGRQELRLESQDVDQLSHLIGILQERLLMQSLQFSVSEGKQRQIEDQLIEQALADFQARAEIIRKALGAEDYRLLDVSVQSGDRDRVVPMRMEAASVLRQSSITKPAIEQGTSRLTVQVSGSIRLLRD